MHMFHADSCTKKSPGRGVGIIPSVCPSGYYQSGLLCYPNCKSGYHPVGSVCWESCRSGYTDGGAFCYTPTVTHNKGLSCQTCTPGIPGTKGIPDTCVRIFGHKHCCCGTPGIPATPGVCIPVCCGGCDASWGPGCTDFGCTVRSHTVDAGWCAMTDVFPCIPFCQPPLTCGCLKWLTIAVHMQHQLHQGQLHQPPLRNAVRQRALGYAGEVYLGFRVGRLKPI